MFLQIYLKNKKVKFLFALGLIVAIFVGLVFLWLLKEIPASSLNSFDRPAEKARLQQPVGVSSEELVNEYNQKILTLVNGFSVESAELGCESFFPMAEQGLLSLTVPAQKTGRHLQVFLDVKNKKIPCEELANSLRALAD